MKKSIFVLLLLIISAVILTSPKEEVKALDFAADFFNTSDVEITPNSSIPRELGLADYRYGMRLTSSIEGSSVTLNDTFVGKFTIDMMPYSTLTYGGSQYETANYSNTYQDLNTLSLKFKNKADSKEFKIVLNGGAGGNNVTVNAHIDLNGEKMGLYYPTTNVLTGNTKGANDSGVYTYLWGTSFSNMAVSSEAYSTKNVKSLKIEFDPINMCVYGYSYGYSKNETKKMLIRDLSKETMDGSDFHQVLSSFDEYEVSICYEDINVGREANLLIYSINGQKFSNTLINNNIGPISMVKLNSGKVNEKYTLPLPKAYDIIDGTIPFSGTVEVIGPDGNKVDLYNNNSLKTNNNYEEGLYFTPNVSGEYKVVYTAKDSKNLLGEALEQGVYIEGSKVEFKHNLQENLYFNLNSTFNIPDAKVLVNGVESTSTFKVYSPSNTLLDISKELNLKEEGLYKLIYQATVDGVLYEDIVNIYSSNKALDLFNSKNCLNVNFDTLNLNNDVYGVVVDTKLETSTITFKEALDLNYLDGKTCLVSLQANPTEWGIKQFSAITIKLIDAENPNNYVRVYCSEGSSESSFVRAGSAEQRLAGLTSDGTVSQTSSNGTTISHSFNGIAKNANIIDQNFEVYFDYDSKKLYTTDKLLVADLDDSEYYSTLWNGFSGNKFYLEISISGISGEASYLINKIAGLNLINDFSVDITKPIISYNESDFIEGLVNTYYPIPTVEVVDANSEKINSNIKVTLNGKEISVADNKFLPTELGRYVITYEFVDNFGNVSTFTKRVLVKDYVEPIVLEVEDAVIDGFVGETINVPSYKAQGGSGDLNVIITATGVNSGEKYILEGLSFVPYVADEYIITYSASDRLGNINEKEVELKANIVLSSKPIIMAPAYIPNVLVDGIEMQFAQTVAYDYNNENDNTVEVELYLIINGKEVKVNDYRYTLSLDKMNDVVTLVYRATSKVTNETAQLSYDINAVRLYESNGNLNISQYLITNGFDNVKATDSSIELTATKSNATIQFIKNVYSDGFQIGFNVPAAANNVDKVTIYLSDSLDSSKVIKLDIIKANLTDSFSYLIINDDVKVTMVGTFYGTTANRLKVAYDGTLNAIKDDSGLVISYLKTYLNGETFTGFNSEINFKIELGNVTGTTIFNLYEVGNQLMSNIDGDFTVPAIVFEDELTRISQINTEVMIPSAKAIDILGFETTLTIRVMAPDKKVIYTSNNGEGTTINIDQYGTYYVYYIGSDENGNPLTQLKLITVLDDVAPTITLEKEVSTTAKVNDKITLPIASCTDNVSSSENITSMIFVIDPNNVMEVVNSNSYTFNGKGRYTIRYFAIDEAGNVSFLDKVVEVK